MTAPSNPPQSATRSRKRLFGLLAAGLGLVALAAVYLVVQLSRDDTPNVETDFSKAACEDFDLGQFAELSAVSVESSDAGITDHPDLNGSFLYCNYTSDSGLTLTITVVAMTDEDQAADSIEQARQVWEEADQTIEDFDNGDLAGSTRVFERESVQHVSLFSAAGAAHAF